MFSVNDLPRLKFQYLLMQLDRAVKRIMTGEQHWMY
jgi:hypothetical protein